MNKKLNTVLYLVLMVSLLACSDDEDSTSNCDQPVTISAQQYNNATSDLLTINMLEIEDDCLSINFGASGCDGSSWILELIDSEAILESLPPQRNVRLTLDNNEDCLAFFTRDISFDIRDLQVDGNEVWINLTNSDKRILYRY